MAEDRLIHIFEQNWLHIRHMEHYRMWGVNIYAVVMAGIIYALSTGVLQPYFPYAAAFLLVLTTTNLLITLKIEAVIEKFADANDVITSQLEVSKYAPGRTRQGKWNIIRFQYIFSAFYGACIIGIIIAIALH